MQSDRLSRGADRVPVAGPSRRCETEPAGITYDRFRLSRLHARLVERLRTRTAIEVPAGGAKACPSLYSLALALAGCRVTLVNPYPDALGSWDELRIRDRMSPIRARIEELPFRDSSFDLAWNFVTLSREESIIPPLREMARVATHVLLVQQNGYNIGYPWHRFLHWSLRIPWTHGQTCYFFPARLKAEMEKVGLEEIEVGLLDQCPWPDPPGFRDVRLHWEGRRSHPEDEVDWNVPAVTYLAAGRFPAWMRLLGTIEDLPIPLLLRWPVNHLYYALGFSGGKRPRSR